MAIQFNGLIIFLMPSLLSFIPPSCMVAPIRESANLNSITYSAMALSS